MNNSFLDQVLGPNYDSGGASTPALGQLLGQQPQAAQAPQAAQPPGGPQMPMEQQLQAQQQGVGPPRDEEDRIQRQAGWKNMLETLQNDPEFLGTLGVIAMAFTGQGSNAQRMANAGYMATMYQQQVKLAQRAIDLNNEDRRIKESERMRKASLEERQMLAEETRTGYEGQRIDVERERLEAQKPLWEAQAQAARASAMWDIARAGNPAAQYGPQAELLEIMAQNALANKEFSTIEEARAAVGREMRSTSKSPSLAARVDEAIIDIEVMKTGVLAQDKKGPEYKRLVETQENLLKLKASLEGGGGAGTRVGTGGGVETGAALPPKPDKLPGYDEYTILQLFKGGEKYKGALGKINQDYPGSIPYYYELFKSQGKLP